MEESTLPAGGSQASESPQQQRRTSLVWWGRLANCVLLAGAVLMIADLVWEGIEEGKWVWYRFGLPLMFIGLAIINFVNMHAVQRRRAEQASTPDSGGV